MSLPTMTTEHGRRAARIIASALVGILLASGIGVAVAYWLSNDNGNYAAAKGDTLPTGATPTASVTGNSSTVSLGFASATTGSGAAVGDYQVTRYPAAGGSGSTATASCTGTTCAVASQPDGSWKFTITPKAGNWLGAESLQSNSVAVDTTPPTVSSINRVTAAFTNAASVQWTVTFSETVTGVDVGDFAVANTGLAGSPAVTGVSPVSGSVYTVTASAGSGSGTLGLNLVDNDSIADSFTNKLGGTGAGNGSFTGQLYTVDRTPPSVVSIDRADASPTNSNTVSWTVTFSESVTGVDTADFTLVDGVPGTPALASPVTGSGTTWTVTTSSTGTSGSGTLGLNLTDNDSILDSATNRLGGTGAGNGNFTGQVYSIDKTAPLVSSIVRAAGSTNPINTGPLSWTVTFSEPVSNVAASNFSTNRSGITGTPTITAPVPSGSEPTATWTVSATTAGVTGTNAGSIELELTTASGITDAVGNTLGATFTSGGTNATFTYDTAAPTLSSINRASSSPTNASTVQWTVTFSETVFNVDAADFSLATSGLSGSPAVTGVTGSGASRTVTASTGGGDGSLGLNFADNDTITDSATNLISTASLTGQAYTIDRTAPTVVSINRVGTSPTNTSGTVQWTVVFSEDVTGVGSGDFGFTKTVSGTPGVTNVSGTNDTYTVTASTGTGSGTVGLNLDDDGSIDDHAGNNVGGNGSGNGNFTGQAYTFDRTAPTVSSIVRAAGSTNPTNTGPLSWTVTFSEPVTNVSASNFSTSRSGITGTPTITAPVPSGAAPTDTWTVSATTSGVTGTNTGSIELELTTTTGITDALGNALGATFTSGAAGATFTYDTTAPGVTSIALTSGATNPAKAGPLSWTVTFSEPVSNVTTARFGLATSNTAGTAPTVTSATAVGGAPAATWTVISNATGTTGQNNGSIGLNLTSTTGITDAVSNALSASTPVVGSAFTFDTTVPTVSSIALSGDNDGTMETNEKIIITFSEPLSQTSLCDPQWANDTNDKSINGNNEASVSVSASDVLTVSVVSGECTTFRLGPISLPGNYNSHASNALVFTGTGNASTDLDWSFSGRSLTIELGSVVTGSGAGTANTGVAAGTVSWSPASGITDRAGNSLGSGPFTDTNERF